MQRLIYLYHYNTKTEGNHTNYQTVNSRITKNFYCYGLGTVVKDVIKWCSSCLVRSKGCPPTKIFPIRGYRPNDRWIANYTELVPGVWVLIIIDLFSKQAFGEVYNSKEEKNVIELFLKLSRKYGNPSIFHSDNGGEFTGKRLNNILQELLVQV